MVMMMMMMLLVMMIIDHYVDGDDDGDNNGDQGGLFWDWSTREGAQSLTGFPTWLVPKAIPKGL